MELDDGAAINANEIAEAVGPSLAKFLPNVLLGIGQDIFARFDVDAEHLQGVVGQQRALQLGENLGCPVLKRATSTREVWPISFS